VLTHAIIDALLGADARETSQTFPPGEPQYKEHLESVLLRKIRDESGLGVAGR